MKKSLIALIGAAALIVACTTTQQRVVYNSLYTLETGTTSAYDAFLDQVVAGKIAVQKVPPVAHAYNDFQAGMGIAVAAAAYNWTAVAPTNVTALATRVLTEISTARQ